MSFTKLRDMACEVVKDRAASRDRQRVAYELLELFDSVHEIISRDDAPVRTKSKAAAFLGILVEKAEELGPKILGEAYLLNCVGEAMVRLSYVSEPILEFLRKGLYFYGIEHIERFQRPRAVRYMTAHADLVVEYTSRDSVKAMLHDGRERLEAGRPFCLVHHYLNALRRRYWTDAKASEDACDVAMSFIAPDEAETDSIVEFAAPTSANDRVRLMLELFRTRLSPVQQSIYAARHHVADSTDMGDELARLFSGSEEDRRWADIASRHDITEKTAKREYLRALDTLLRESARAVFGETIPSSYVRRFLDTIRSIVQTRDLRIRDNAGRGLGRIVERWEVALRFVLNHGRPESTGLLAEAEGESEI